MNIRRLFILLFCIYVPVAFCAQLPVTEGQPPTVSLAPMLSKVTPAIVNIVVERKSAPADNDTSSKDSSDPTSGASISVGSGIVFDAARGLIVTNAHVVDHGQLIVATLKNGQRYIAHLVGQDNGFDIAVLRIDAPHLTAIPFGDSDQLQVGDFVAAIGSPFGLSLTVTSGVISALDRSEPKIEGYQSFIQTDAPINPGNSGGALVNLKGQVIGMNTAIITPTNGSIGIGFAIPSNMVKSVAMQLIQYGKVERGMLGVIAQDISTVLAKALDLSTDHGVIVTQIVPGSAAEKAGLQMEDIVLAINQKPIRNAVQLRNMLGILPPKTELNLTVLRQHQTHIFNVIIGSPKDKIKTKGLPFLTGLRLQNFDELETDGTEIAGVLVVGVEPGSKSMLAGLTPGDIIRSANSNPITSIADLKNAVLKSPQKPLLLLLFRDGDHLFAVVAPNEQHEE